MNSFFELLKSRRSIRKYSSAIIEHEKIELITRAALMSPASKRSNSWEFIIVQQTETIQLLSESREHGSQFMSGAPLSIVVTADTTKSDVWFEDASIATIIMQLEAKELGLGSCWVQIYGRQKNGQQSSEEYIKNLLGIPDNFAVLCVLAIGYPAEEKQSFDENSLQTHKIHWEKF